jgi:hypothetical protein
LPGSARGARARPCKKISRVSAVEKMANAMPNSGDGQFDGNGSHSGAAGGGREGGGGGGGVGDSLVVRRFRLPSVTVSSSFSLTLPLPPCPFPPVRMLLRADEKFSIEIGPWAGKWASALN